MINRIVIPWAMWNGARQSLFPVSGDEGFSFGLARKCHRKNSTILIVEDYTGIQCKELQSKSTAHLVLGRHESNILNKLSVDAAKNGHVPVHVHSHPSGAEYFSTYDDDQERKLSQWLQSQDQPYLVSIVAPRGGAPRARLWQNGNYLDIAVQIGLQIQEKNGNNNLPALDRQRAFGPLFQLSAAKLQVGIVGVGGVGLPVAEQLARCGFRRFVLVDPDEVSESNLNRLQSLRKSHIGTRKVDVVADTISRAASSIGNVANINSLHRDINTLNYEDSLLLGNCDIVLALTDDTLSRIACLRMALENGAEYLQAGMDIRLDEQGTISNLISEFTGAEVGRYCPICTGRLDPGQASLEAREYVGGHVWDRAQREGYIPDIPNPSIMSLNAVCAGMLVSEIQQRMAGLGTRDLGRIDLHTGETLFLNNLGASSIKRCMVCGNPGMGDAS